jgi:hypothetical protein
MLLILHNALSESYILMLLYILKRIDIQGLEESSLYRNKLQLDCSILFKVA